MYEIIRLRNFNKNIIMKKLLLLTVTVLFSASSFAQDDMEAMQQAWMDYMMPGEVHEMLSSYSGEWEATVTHYMPGQEPMTQKDMVSIEMILEGRYQQSTHNGNFMGMPFNGISTTGYDKARDVFVNTWVDNMGTGMMYGEGKWDARTRSIEFKGNMTDPMTKKPMPYREVFTMKDENSMNMTMYSTHDGKEIKMMEVVYARK